MTRSWARWWRSPSATSPRLRHLTLGLHVERRPQTAVTEVDLLLRHLPELRSLDVAQYDWQRLTHLFPATLPPPFICRLLSLTVSPLLFYHLIYESAPLPSLVRVALDLDAPFPHEEDPDPLLPSRSALAVFPALRYLDLPADFPLPLHSLDGGHTGVGWAELLHVRWNMAFPWTRSLPPALTQLTSLHLLVDLHSPSFGGDALEGLSTFHMPNDVIQEAFDSLWQLTQLTLTLRPPRVRLHTDRREDLSALQSDGEARLVASLDCWLQPLCSLRFLFIDAGRRLRPRRSDDDPRLSRLLRTVPPEVLAPPHRTPRTQSPPQGAVQSGSLLEGGTLAGTQRMLHRLVTRDRGSGEAPGRRVGEG